MKRIDVVYDKLIELSGESGITTDKLADSLGLSRANVSSDLNQLCSDGKAAKEGTKPVLYRAIPAEEAQPSTTVLDRFTARNPSLFPSVEQAKAAVLYPPKGMPILILGETGTGKSMFAGLIHQYAVEMKRMPEASPFIGFNCADYANNPQLLLSQLFGARKGSYTGADSDKAGLIEKAHEGVLFLDEVHRLPPEGQEMFFTFMDTGKYRRLGETECERTSKTLIISATTEDPDSTLLKTFTRRIPMIIRMPNLHERNIEERFNLISQFFRAESSRLAKPISVSINSMKSFLSYHCPNNVGQLRTDIQLACAKAYADFISNKKDLIRINSTDLPSYIRDGLYLETEHRQLWTKLVGINKRYCIFDSGEENILFEENEETIYDMIDLRVHELKSHGVTSEVLEQEMEKDIQEYFSSYLESVNRRIDFSNLESIVSPDIIRVVEEIIRFSEEKLGKSFSTQIHYGMAVHISNSIERIKRGKKIINPQFNKIRTQYNEEFSTAVDCLKIISRVLDITMPIDEAGFLAMFLVYHEGNIKEVKNNVKIMVIAHGSSTATSMAETANHLLGVRYAVGINAPLDEKPQDIIAKLKDFLKESMIHSDILFLVDMGSLINFGVEIAKEFGIRVKTIPLVSTLHVIEATRKAMLGYSLEEVYQDTLRVNEFLDNDYSPSSNSNNPDALAIVTLCTTGDGGAEVIKSILEKGLNFGTNPVKIIPLSIVGNESVEVKLDNINKEYRLICVIGSFRVNTDVPQYSMVQILNQSALKDIQKLIDTETTYFNIEDTFKNHLPNINSTFIIQGIKKFISHMENALHIKLTPSVLVGVVMHLGCMVDRIKSGGNIPEFKNKQRFITENLMLYTFVKNECAALDKKYQIEITDDEICHLMVFLDPKNNM